MCVGSSAYTYRKPLEVPVKQKLRIDAMLFARAGLPSGVVQWRNRVLSKEKSSAGTCQHSARTGVMPLTSFFASA